MLLKDRYKGKEEELYFQKSWMAQRRHKGGSKRTEWCEREKNSGKNSNGCMRLDINLDVSLNINRMEEDQQRTMSQRTK